MQGFLFVSLFFMKSILRIMSEKLFKTLHKKINVTMSQPLLIKILGRYCKVIFCHVTKEQRFNYQTGVFISTDCRVVAVRGWKRLSCCCCSSLSQESIFESTVNCYIWVVLFLFLLPCTSTFSSPQCAYGFLNLPSVSILLTYSHFSLWLL